MKKKHLPVESPVWTDDEIKLLLRVTLDYKCAKYKGNVKWESCHSKYADITAVSL